MRCLVRLAFFAAMTLGGPVLAQTPPAPQADTKSTHPPAGKIATEAELSRQRTEDREREWDRKMRASTKSICKGC